jgi:hypothetical protein
MVERMSINCLSNERVRGDLRGGDSLSAHFFGASRNVRGQAVPSPKLQILIALLVFRPAVIFSGSTRSFWKIKVG